MNETLSRQPLSSVRSGGHAFLRRSICWVFLVSVVGGGGVFAQARPSSGPVPSRQQTAVGPDKKRVAQGQLLFQNNCSPCHNFLQRGIGPSLGQVTAQVAPPALKQFIRNAPDQIKRGDARATRLFAEYKQVMPAFTTLNEGELEALLAYIGANQRRESPTIEPADLGTVLTDPIPAKPLKSGLRLQLTEVLTAPATAPKAPRARINKMAVLPGPPERVFLQELRGLLYEQAGDSLRVVMDIRNERPGFIHAPGLGSGFGSFAFHPEFAKNGLLYTTHTEKAGSARADFVYADSIPVALQWVLTEWKIASPAGAVFAGAGRELMRVNMVSPIHGVQETTFNPVAQPGSPDYGLLYIGIGDGGATENGYPFLSQSNRHIWGSVVRIDPLGTNGPNGRYGIPPVNPYAHDNDPATLGEVFCRGFRNPNRLTWTPDGTMLITDIGQANAEELNIGIAGADYGWPEREGTFRINPHGKMSLAYALPPNDAAFHYTYPVAQYDHDEGNAISGGFVYTGTALPLLTGKYVFGDVVNGRVYFVESKALKPGVQAPIQEVELELAGKETTFQQLTGAKKTDLRFGLGANRELFLFTKTDGKLYRVTGCSRQR